MHKDLKKIRKALEAQGFTTSVNNLGHLEVRKDGERVTTFSGTPSDTRSWKNSISHARRHGFTWPPRR